jgi:serine/threonine protein kinase
MRGSSRDSAAESCAFLLSSDDIVVVDFKNRDINTIVDPSEVYKFKQLLGEGSFGLVYRGELMQSDEEVAIKVLPCSNQYDIGSEVEFLRKFECPHVVSFQQAFVFNKELWIVMEYCAGGSVGKCYHII